MAAGYSVTLRKLVGIGNLIKYISVSSEYFCEKLDACSKVYLKTVSPKLYFYKANYYQMHFALSVSELIIPFRL
jgi:hypothetical protein